MKFLVSVCILAALFVASVYCDTESVSSVPGQVLTDDTITLHFDNYDVNQDMNCQSCYNFFLNKDGESTSHFRYYYRWFLELDSNGQQCCTSLDSGCTPLVGCNQHNILSFPPNLKINQNAQLPDSVGVQYVGVLSSSGTSTCVPPGSGQDICANFTFTYYIASSTKNITVAPGHYMTVNQHAAVSTIKMANWPFAAGSTGMRMKLGVGAAGQIYIEGFRLFPGGSITSDKSATANPLPVNYFDTVGVQTRLRLAKVGFSPVANIDDGTPRSVNLSGPFRHEFDPYSKYFFVDVPVFTQSFEYTSVSYFDPEEISSATSACVSLLVLFCALFLLL